MSKVSTTTLFNTDLDAADARELALAALTAANTRRNARTQFPGKLSLPVAASDLPPSPSPSPSSPSNSPSRLSISPLSSPVEDADPELDTAVRKPTCRTSARHHVQRCTGVEKEQTLLLVLCACVCALACANVF